MLSQSGHGWLLSVRNMAPNNFISMHFWYFRKFGKLTIKGASCQNLSRFQNARRWGALAHSPLDRILVHRGLFPLPSPLSLVPNVSFPWCFLGASYLIKALREETYCSSVITKNGDPAWQSYGIKTPRLQPAIRHSKDISSGALHK